LTSRKEKGNHYRAMLPVGGGTAAPDEKFALAESRGGFGPSESDPERIGNSLCITPPTLTRVECVAFGQTNIVGLGVLSPQLDSEQPKFSSHTVIRVPVFEV
jgi:hypothetical protein